MKASSIFSPGEGSTRITLSGTFRLITKKNMPLFLWCPQLMFSAPQIPCFLLDAVKGTHKTWTPGLKANLCKMAVTTASQSFNIRDPIFNHDFHRVPLIQ
ncbi:hypothetical protein TNCV_635491 [Trichonephila clavipes]|nr:hypothetical protein TNCV_635491 [Trichonephila clavipes]